MIFKVLYEIPVIPAFTFQRVIFLELFNYLFIPAYRYTNGNNLFSFFSFSMFLFTNEKRTKSEDKFFLAKGL